MLKYWLSLGVALLGMWLLWSGHYTTLLVGLGVVSTITAVLIGLRMRIVDGEGAPLQLPLRAVVYIPWLLWEVVLANLDVAWRIVHPRMPIQPRVMRIRASQKTDLGRVIYANSITLTPGTVSIAVSGKDITVHALTEKAAEGLANGEMDRRVRGYEGES